MRRTGMLVGLLLLGGVSSGWAQNLIPNGDFVADTSGWQVRDFTGSSVQGTVTLAWEPTEDALGQTSSGALRIAWDVMDPNGNVVGTTVALGDCLTAVQPGVTYRAGAASVQIDPEPSPGGFIWFQGHSTSDCSFLEPPDLPMTAGFGPGYSFQSADLTLDSAVQSFRVTFDILLAPDGTGATRGTGEALLDKLFFRPASEIEPFTALPALVSVSGLTASFLGASGGGESPFPPNFFWTFGDGMSSMEQSPLHSYPAVETYTASLVVDSGYEGADQTLEVDLTLPPSVVEIPTLSMWSLGLLALLLAAGGVLFASRRAG